MFGFFTLLNARKHRNILLPKSTVTKMHSDLKSDLPTHLEFADLDKKSTTEKATATKDIEAITSDPDRRRREKRLVRKLDLTLLPTVWMLYMFNYLDRNAIAQAKLNNIESDLGLVGDQFNTAISILNVG